MATKLALVRLRSVARTACPRSFVTEGLAGVAALCLAVVATASARGATPGTYLSGTLSTLAGATIAGSCQATTISQGGWSSTPQGQNAGTLLDAYFANTKGVKVVIGCNAKSGKALTFTSANAIRAFLPTSTTPNVLTASATNPKTSAGGVFAGQVLALRLDVLLSDAGLLPPGLSAFVIAAGPAAGKTVGTVLADANAALGGCGLPAYAATIAKLNDVVTSLIGMCYRFSSVTNRPPVVSAGSDQTVTLPAGAQLSGTATDDGLPNPPGQMTFNWSQVSGPMPATFALPTQLNTAVAFPAPGTYVFRITANDGALAVSATMQVVVNPAPAPVNQPPVVGAGANQVVTLPAAANLHGTVSDDGLPVAATVMAAWSQESGPMPSIVTTPTTVDTAATFVQPGTYVFRLTASDGALSASATTQVTVLDGPPSLSAPGDRTVPLGSTLEVRLTATDPNPNDRLTYQLDGGPVGAVLGADHVVRWTPTALQLGATSIAAHVQDSFGHSDATTFAVTAVAANRPPQLAPQPDADVRIGGIFARTLSATDPDSDPLAFSLISGPAGMSVNGSQLSWPPVPSAPGSHVVTVAVTDSGGLIDSARFTLTVVGATPPRATRDAYEVALGQTLTIPAAGVLANDIQGDGGALSAAVLTQPDKGQLTSLNADGSFTYAAPALPQGPPLALTMVRNYTPASQQPTTQPLMADVDHDGVPDIIAFYLNTNMGVISGATGALLFEVNSLPSAEVGGKLCVQLPLLGTNAVGDIDDDGEVELIVKMQCSLDQRDDGVLVSGVINRIAAVVYDPTKAKKYRVKWLTALLPDDPRQGNVAGLASMTIARLTPNEPPSVLFGQTYDAFQKCGFIRGSFASDRPCRVVFALNGADGSVRQVYYSTPAANLPGYSVWNDFSHNGFMPPLVADVDNDGSLDILYEGTLWSVDGTVKRQFDGIAGMFASTSSALADIDGDAEMEIVTVHVKAPVSQTNLPGAIRAWKANGALLWASPVPQNNIVTKLVVADVDRDGHPNFIFGGPQLGPNTPQTHAYIWVLDHLGRIVWVRNIRNSGDTFEFRDPTFPVYDLNGDGIMDLVVAYGRNTIRLLRADTGQEQTSWTYPGTAFFSGNNGASIQSPIVVDDGSGEAKIIWYRDPGGVGAYVVVLGSAAGPWRPAPRHRNQWAFWDSNFNADESIPLTYPRHTTDPRTNVLSQMPQAPYAAGFTPADATSFTYAATDAAGQSSGATVALSLVTQNRAPIFTSTAPRFYVRAGAAAGVLNYDIDAVDPDSGDTITYAVLYGLSTAGTTPTTTIDPASGYLQIGNLAGGDNAIVVTGTDSHGAVTYHSFMLRLASGSTAVPNVITQTLGAATATLGAAGLVVGNVTAATSPAAPGTVISQSPPAGTTIPQGDVVHLVTSLGAPPALVPSVIGKATTAAVTLLATNGFSATTTPVFSSTAPSGVVLGQSPTAGSLASPSSGPIALTVSVGQGLTIGLSRGVTTADQPITITTTAVDVNGSPVAPPALTYAITPQRPQFQGALPVVSGNSIFMGTTTLGTFTVTATDTANSRMATANFVVLPPRAPQGGTNGEVYAQMFEVLEQIHALRAPMRAALAANDVGQMSTLLQQFVLMWRTVDLEQLRISQPLVTPDKFPPTIEMMQAWGYGATASDVLAKQILKDAISDLTAWTAKLKTTGASAAQLDTLADQFSTRAARMDGVAISKYGGISNTSEYTRLLSHAIPEFYEAVSEELAALTGLPPRNAPFPLLAQVLDAARPRHVVATRAAHRPGFAKLLARRAAALASSLVPSTGRARSGALSVATRTMRRGDAMTRRHRISPPGYGGGAGSLAELAITQATQMVVDKIIEEANAAYANAKQFAVDIMGQAGWTAAAVMITGEVRDFLQGQKIEEVVSGASLSFREFQQGPAWIETPADADASVNVVMVIGPNLLTAAKNAAETFVTALKEGFSLNIQPNLNAKAYRNPDKVRQDVSAFVTLVKQALGDVDVVVQQQAKLVFQSPDSSLNGCVFTNVPGCRQLVYDNGFQPVYTYTPPPGYGGFSGLPVPIVFIVYNAATGVMYFGTPPFLPCQPPAPGQPIACPNNPPLVP